MMDKKIEDLIAGGQILRTNLTAIRFGGIKTADLVPGTWYYGWMCEQCVEMMPALIDKTGGKTPVPIHGENTKLHIKCMHCGHENVLPIESQHHYRQPA